jgi:hypothetical protein
MNKWLHVGGEDPFCFYEVRYDTWWLTGADYKQHCASEFQKRGCMLLKTVDEKDTTGFLQVERVVRCLGLKHSSAEIKNANGGWRQIFEHFPPRASVVGKIYMFVEGGKYQPIIEHALEHCLVYDGLKLNRLIGSEGQRTDMPLQEFKIGQPTDMDGVNRMGGLTQAGGQELPVTAKCDFIAHAIETSACRVTDVAALCSPCNDTSSTRATNGYYLFTRGDLTGLCSEMSVTESSLISRHTQLSVDDVRVTWWTHLFETFKFWISDLLGGAVTSVFGRQWQTGICVAIVIYYMVVAYSGSAIVAGVVSVLATWSFLQM